MKQWIEETDLYRKYRYKKRDIEGKSVFPPYIKKADCSDHPFALTYRQWKIIIRTYFGVLIEELLKGKTIELMYRMGTLTLYKLKVYNSPDYVKTKQENKLVVFKNVHTMGYKPYLVWRRYRQGRFMLKMFYKMTFRRSLWTEISNIITEDPSVIFNWKTLTQEKR